MCVLAWQYVPKRFRYLLFHVSAYSLLTLVHMDFRDSEGGSNREQAGEGVAPYSAVMQSVGGELDRSRKCCPMSIGLWKSSAGCGISFPSMPSLHRAGNKTLQQSVQLPTAGTAHGTAGVPLSSRARPAALLLSEPPFKITAIPNGRRPLNQTSPRCSHANLPRHTSQRALKPEFVRHGVSTTWKEGRQADGAHASLRKAAGAAGLPAHDLGALRGHPRHHPSHQSSNLHRLALPEPDC
jgi:hypothetical protein